MCTKQRNPHREQHKIRIISLGQQPYLPVLGHLRKWPRRLSVARISVNAVGDVFALSSSCGATLRTGAAASITAHHVRHGAGELPGRGRAATLLDGGCHLPCLHGAASPTRCLARQWGLISGLGRRPSRVCHWWDLVIHLALCHVHLARHLSQLIKLAAFDIIVSGNEK
jgi:hypothetical protein